MSSYYFNQGNFIKSNEMILLKTFYLDNLNSAPHWCCKTVELTSISRSEMLQYIIKIVWGECSGESLVIEMNLRLVEHIRPTQINWWYFHVLVCSNPFQWSVFIFWTTLSQLHCFCLIVYLKIYCLDLIKIPKRAILHRGQVRESMICCPM